MTQAAEKICPPLWTRRNLLAISIGTVAVVVAAWCVARIVQGVLGWWAVEVDSPRHWPLSIFSLKIPGVRAPLAGLWSSAAVGLLFSVMAWKSRSIAAGRFRVILAGFLLVMGTNLIHGPQYGLVRPHQGGEQYYEDAVRVSSAGQLLREFGQLQPRLGVHARSHPPGAVLFFYALIHTVGHGAAVSMVIAALAVGFSGAFLYGVLSRDFDRDTCGYVTLLFLLIPAVQIYYCATLDAVIASCFLGVLLSIRHRSAPLGIGGAVVSLFCASFLTFAACFLVPVVVGYEIITRRSVRRSAVVLVGVGVLYTAMYLFCGFDYVDSFRTASALENPGGFLLFAEPASYVMTRLEDVANIAWFFGPFLLVLFVRGVQVMWRTAACRDLLALTVLGIATLLAMFLSGAFRTGETARACLFIYPYLIFPVAAYLEQRGRYDDDRRLLLSLVFGQSLAMQTLGGYFW